jgi:hypothetical protein
MKALPMLDHVMLWIARIFLILVIMFASLPFVFLALNLATALWMWLVFPDLRDTVFSTFAEDLRRLSHQPLAMVTLGYALFWFFTFKLLPGKVARICLGLSSGLLLAMFIHGTITVILLRLPALSSHESFLIEMGLYFVIGMIGFASFFWISVRPPQNPRKSGSNSFPHPPLPQSC